MALSVLMAIVVPMLKGGELSFSTLQPMIWILLPLYFTFFTGFWLRRHEFKRRAREAATAQISKNETMIDVLQCRHWMRAYDSAYPVQHVRKAFDEACALTGQMKGGFGAAKQQRVEGWTQEVFMRCHEISVDFGPFPAISGLWRSLNAIVRSSHSTPNRSPPIPESSRRSLAARTIGFRTYIGHYRSNLMENVDLSAPSGPEVSSLEAMPPWRHCKRAVATSPSGASPSF